MNQKFGVNSIEGRSLRERFTRHANLREILKEPDANEVDSSDEELQAAAAKQIKVSKIEQEFLDADKVKNEIELQTLTQSIVLEAKHRLVKLQRDPTNDDLFEFHGFDFQSGMITLRRIFDQHGI